MISVCIATYNGEKYIKKQLTSILSQLNPEDEVIISDDKSTDNTIDEIEKFKDSRIKIYINEDNHGFVKNFENALSKARGDTIFLADQDDEWFPNKISKTMEALKKADFVVSDCITTDSNGNILDSSRFKTFNIKKGFWRLMIKTRYLGCCMAFNRKVLEVALPFPPRSFYIEHDLWLASVAELYFKVELIKEPLIYYIRHDNNTSDAGFGKGFSLYNKIIRRLYRIYWLLKIKNRMNKK